MKLIRRVKNPYGLFEWICLTIIINKRFCRFVLVIVSQPHLAVKDYFSCSPSHFSASSAAAEPNPAAACRATSTAWCVDVDHENDEIVAAGKIIFLEPITTSRPLTLQHCQTRRRSQPDDNSYHARHLRQILHRYWYDNDFEPLYSPVHLAQCPETF